jgi:hypothetical protein
MHIVRVLILFKIKSVEEVRFSTYNPAVQTDSIEICDFPFL